MKSCDEQTHVHEVQGSVRIFDENGEVHNHRFAGVTGQAIPVKNCTERTHYHKFISKTDFYEDHFHEIEVRFGRAIPVGGGRHVHFVYAKTECSDGHKHEFIVATLIENPIGEQNDRCEC